MLAQANLKSDGLHDVLQAWCIKALTRTWQQTAGKKSTQIYEYLPVIYTKRHRQFHI